MSAIEMAIEKVKHSDEAHARQSLAWLQPSDRTVASEWQPAGAMKIEFRHATPALISGRRDLSLAR